MVVIEFGYNLTMLIASQPSTDGPPALAIVDTDRLHYDPSRRRVLFLPGEGVHQRSDAAMLRGTFKCVEQTLASTLVEGNPPTDIFLNPYELPYEDFQARAPHYAMQRNDISHYGRAAFQFALLPMLLGSDERLSDLTPAVLKERLSHVTLVSHSYGSIVIQDMANALAMKLRTIGWDEPTISDTMKEMVSVSVAPVSRADYPAPNFTQYFFTSMNDMSATNFIRNENPDRKVHIPLLAACGYVRMAEVMARHDTIIPRQQLLDEVLVEVQKTRRPGVTPRAQLNRAPSGYIISSLLPDREVKWIERRWNGHEVCRVLDDEEVKRTQTAVVHDWRTYLHGDHKLGEVLINVMNNAVQREVGIGDGHRMLLTTHQTRRQHEYRFEANERAGISERGVLTKLAETPRR